MILNVWHKLKWDCIFIDKIQLGSLLEEKAYKFPTGSVNKWVGIIKMVAIEIYLAL